MAVRQPVDGESSGLGDDFRRSRDEARKVASDMGDIASDVRYLVQKEAELARAEFQESLSRTIQSAVSAVIAIVFANLLLIFAFTTVMLALYVVVDLWLAALITTGIILLITLIAAGFAYARMKQVSFTPQLTMRSLREDMEWAKSQIKSIAR